jgi:benzoyl-CoA 2,3-dioxygenase component B
MFQDAVDFDCQIPNNVGLRNDIAVHASMAAWHGFYLDWWRSMGPEGFDDALVYLRTTVGLNADGWAKFDYVRMAAYRWAVLLAPAVPGRRIAFGAHKDEPAWQTAPRDYRGILLRLLTIQGDAEPASVEQQRHLGKTAPSLYDMRNLFQLNVEEARHLWAMVYLLLKYLGNDGRDAAEGLLRRRSGSADNPRILKTFNDEIPDWLSFYLFSFFTDRDGKMQLAALSQSGFDPLSRTCRFMLTEEAHHMFIGEDGVRRVIRRTCEAMRQAGIDDPTDVRRVRALGVIDLPTLQKKINQHTAMALDLFGNEISDNASQAFDAGLKGRFNEAAIDDDHQLLTATYPVLHCRDGKVVNQDIPARSALNARLRDDYLGDCVKGLFRWNETIRKAGFRFVLTLPNVAFNRRIGSFAQVFASPDGRLIDAATWAGCCDQYLPSGDDEAFIMSLMKPVRQPGEFAGWIAPPHTMTDNRPGNFEYVRIAS